MIAKKNKIPIHLDGARLWNASVKSNIPIREYCKHFDSASLCLSKGLGSPIGSVIVGSHRFIRKASFFRKLYGGGWRQAGILAAAGIYAINRNLPLIERDHLNALFISNELENLGIDLIRQTETNMVWFDISKFGNMSQLSKIASNYGICLNGGVGTTGRIVLHKDIDRDGALLFLKSMKEFIR